MMLHEKLRGYKYYRIIYRIENFTVYILTVRNYKQILPINEIMI
jgi:hypothetical protein